MIHISLGNSKLKNIPNINLPPVISCPKGIPCANEQCYALKSYRMYPNVRKAWDTNLQTYNSNPTKYFNLINDFLKKKKKVRRFRWHSSGDIQDQFYLDNMIDIANNFPKIKFLCFTKRHDLNYINIPLNLSIRISLWPGLNVPNLNLPKAWLDDGRETRLPNNGFQCLGSCSKCAYCWNGKRDVIFKKH